MKSIHFVTPYERVAYWAERLLVEAQAQKETQTELPIAILMTAETAFVEANMTAAEVATSL